MRKKSGSAAIVLALSITLLVLAIPIFNSYRGNQSTQVRQTLMASAAQLVRSQVLAIIQDDRAWAATLVGNGALTVGQPMTLFHADGTVAFDSTAPTNGFAVNGQACNTFNAVTGDDKCPFRYQIQYQSNQIVRAQFLFRSQTLRLGSWINSYNLVTPDPVTGMSDYINGVYNRDTDVSDKKASCLAAGGTYDPISRTCDNVYVEKNCPAAEFMPSSIATVPCQRSPAQTQVACQPGEVIGRFLDGSFNCINRYNYAN